MNVRIAATATTAKGHAGRLVAAVLLVLALLALTSAGGVPSSSADSTGFRNPSAQSADTGGDGDGYETSPEDSLLLDGRTAEDRDSGTNTTLSCTNAGKDRHRFYNYGFSIPAGAVINGIEARANARLDNGPGYMCVLLSWDGGATWTAPRQTANLTTAFADYTVGGTTDNWGRTWSVSEFSNANLRVRLVDVASTATARFRLDWIGVQVHYTPAPPDSTGPVTSSVGAADAGGGLMTLTANVSDATTGGSNITAAEYFVDVLGTNGSGAAMSATDGAFNSATEDVTAAVDMSGQSPGNHTLYVHGRDAAGNWGAAGSVVVSVTTGGGSAVQATITLVAGTLSMDAYPVDFAPVTLNGLDQTIDTSPQPWRVMDARGTGTGWSLTVTSSDFSTAGGTIPVANFRVQQLQSKIVVNSGNTPPTSQASSYQVLGNAVPLKLLSAAAGEGMGSYDFTPDFRLTIPASTIPGEYHASLVVSVNSGP